MGMDRGDGTVCGPHLAGWGRSEMLPREGGEEAREQVHRGPWRVHTISQPWRSIYLHLSVRLLGQGEVGVLLTSTPYSVFLRPSLAPPLYHPIVSVSRDHPTSIRLSWFSLYKHICYSSNSEHLSHIKLVLCYHYEIEQVIVYNNTQPFLFCVFKIKGIIICFHKRITVKYFLTNPIVSVVLPLHTHPLHPKIIWLQPFCKSV